MAMAANDKAKSTDPMDLNALTAGQSASLKELKQRFVNNTEPNVHDEYYLLHWLRARRFDVDKAESMLRYHLQYRKALNMDGPTYKNFVVHPVMEAYYTRGQIGHDKIGRPVVYWPFGGIDPKGILSSIRHSEAMKTIMYWIDKRNQDCQEASRKAGKHISQIVYVIDVQSLGVKHLWKPGIDVFQQLSQALHMHSPEIIYKLYVINAPNIFYSVYKLIKPILDENTRRKINIYGDNFREALLEVIDADQLPAYYGGTMLAPDGDPRCSHAIKYGGEVPVDLYFKDTITPLDSELSSLTISRGNQTVMPVVVQKPGTTLKWYFKEATNDIGFGIYKKLNDKETDLSKMEMVYPYARVYTALVPEWGQITLKEPGTYLVQFDNSYSWIHSKYLKYRVALEEL